MAKQQSAQKKPTAPQASATPIPFLQPRAFANEATKDISQPDVEAQIDQACTFGHSLGQINTRPLSHVPIQPKLTIGKVGDPYEQEADQVAAQVVARLHTPKSQAAVAMPKLQPKAALRTKAQNQPVQRSEAPEEDELQMKPLASSIQRSEAPEEEDELQMKPLAGSIQRSEAPEEDELQMKPTVQRKTDPGGTAASATLEASISQARGGGQAMSDAIRQPMEQAFGANFSNVRIHSDSQSDQLNRSINAQAFTTKNDIFFSKGKYNPGDRGGQELLAHELTHVVQQQGNNIQRKSIDIANFSSEFTVITRHRELRSIQNKVKDYNKIKFGATNYGDQLKLLDEIETLSTTWMSKHEAQGDIEENKYTSDVDRIWYEADVEREKVKQEQRGESTSERGSDSFDVIGEGMNTGLTALGANSTYEAGGNVVRMAKADSLIGEAKKIVDETNLAHGKELAKAAAGTWIDKLIGGAKSFLKFLDTCGILPIIKLISSCAKFWSALSDYKSLSKAAESLGNTEGSDLKLIEAVKHGVSKVFRRVWSAGYDCIRALIDTIMSLATIISGGMAAPAKAIASTAGAVLDGIALLYRKGKGIWKAITGKRGKHRQQSAETIVNTALDGDAVALQLLVDLSPIGLMERLKRFILPWKKSAPPKVESPEAMRQLLWDLRRSPGEMGMSIPEFMGLVKEQLKSFA